MNVTPPVEFAAWIACLAFAVMGFNQLARAWFTVRGKPSPAETAANSAALSERIAQIETRTCACKKEQDQRIAALEAEQAKVRDLIASEIDKVFNRVNAVANLAATMNGELGIIKSQLNMLLRRDPA
jgi:hypothetical protein